MSGANKCIFCQIVKKEIPADIVYEDKDIIAFKDINPKAPVHIQLIPKKHIVSLAQAKEEDRDLIVKLIWQAKLLARQLGIAKRGYNLIMNCGKGAGQIVPHIHLHLIGGGDFSRWKI